MPKTRSADQAAQKWSRVTPERSDDYLLGVQNPRAPWAASTVAAAERYKAGVDDAIKNNRFAGGVQKAGEQTWQRNTADKGPRRFSEGVSLSGPAYQGAVQPFLNAIAGVALPPRYATGDPRNIARVAAIATALRTVKTGQGGR
jgi:hypothetical protein